MKGGLPNGANGGLFASDTATLQDATTAGIVEEVEAEVHNNYHIKLMLLLVEPVVYTFVLSLLKHFLTLNILLQNHQLIL